jgi:hypothetical protein
MGARKVSIRIAGFGHKREIKAAATSAITAPLYEMLILRGLIPNGLLRRVRRITVPAMDVRSWSVILVANSVGRPSGARRTTAYA